MKVAALLTAKGKNTLKNKNIIKINNHEVIAYPAIAAKNSKLINHHYVSSDSNKILKICKKYGYQAIKRPTSISQKNSLHVEALIHSLDFMRKKNIKLDALLVLLGNNVCIKTSWINKSIRMLKNNSNINSIVPAVIDQDHHPYRAKRLKNNGFLETYFNFKEHKVSSNRQSLPKNLFLSHNFWLIKLTKNKLPNNGQYPWNFLGKNVKPFIINSSVDIHEKEDLSKSKVWLEENKIKI